MTTHYKVVRHDENGILSSSTVSSTRSVKYAVGKWTRPRRSCGPLCVFGSMAFALGWRQLLCVFDNKILASVFECEVELSTHKKAWSGSVAECPYEEVKFADLPTDTVLADRVKLGKQVR